eukprot:3884376-Pyramimonas_sp.AAC.1
MQRRIQRGFQLGMPGVVLFAVVWAHDSQGLPIAAWNMLCRLSAVVRQLGNLCVLRGGWKSGPGELVGS